MESGWRGRLVFAFNPHESHFAATLESLIPLPPDLSAEDAVFLPNLETAVNLLHDGAPLVGERVAVFGQGIIGLLVTELLARLPLARFIAKRRAPIARKIYEQIGGSSPIFAETRKQADSLEAVLKGDGIEAKAFVSMRCWHPFSDGAAKAVKAFNPDKIVLLPLYPQGDMSRCQWRERFGRRASGWWPTNSACIGW